MYQQPWRSVAYLFTKMLLDQCFLQRIADGRVHKCQPVNSKSDLSTSLLTAEKVQVTSGAKKFRLSACLGLTEKGSEKSNLAVEVKQVHIMCTTLPVKLTSAQHKFTPSPLGQRLLRSVARRWLKGASCNLQLVADCESNFAAVVFTSGSICRQPC